MKGINDKNEWKSFLWAMTVSILTILVLQYLIVGVDAKEKDPEIGYSFENAKFIEVYDGDTFYVDIPSLHPIFGKRLGIRVRYIDTPEIRSTNKYEKLLGQKAKAFTKEKLEGGKQLRLTECVRGTFSRIVCKVSNDKTADLGAELISNGLAEPYKK